MIVAGRPKHFEGAVVIGSNTTIIMNRVHAMLSRFRSDQKVISDRLHRSLEGCTDYH